ncbi:MAG: hypothetical protein UY96_C0010G0034 [Parcubacteria group bacterium GW2011_GWB1_56_8]|nr:MAG: hypothetical protein UY96_C0010G0034 [Parcubacteria group bacterium GW2011_GWB1_56_8]
MPKCEKCLVLESKVRKLEDDLSDEADRAESAERELDRMEEEAALATDNFQRLDLESNVAALYEEIDLAMNRHGAVWTSDSFNVIPRELVHALKEGVAAYEERLDIVKKS